MIWLALTLSNPLVAQEQRYDPIGRRDPFEQLFGDQSHDVVDNPTRLQRHEPSELRLLGVVWGDEPRALVEDPGGHVHVVTVGTYVGPRWGLVTGIDEDGLVVTEELMNGESGIVTQRHRLLLPVGEAYDLGR